MPFETQQFLVKNPEDWLEAMRETENAIAENEGMDCVVDFTGATKAMAAGALLAAVKKRVLTTYVGGERDGHGQVKTGNEKVNNIFPYSEMIAEMANRSLAMFNTHNYELARDCFNNAVENNYSLSYPGKPSTKELKLAAMLSDAYADWSLFSFMAASGKYDKFVKTLSGECETSSVKGFFKENEPAFKAQAEFLRLGLDAKCKGETRPELFYASLVESAGRCADQGRYDDAVARLYRALEFVSQHALKSDYGIDAGNLTKEQFGEFAEFSSAKATDGGSETYTTRGLSANFRILEKKGDKRGTGFFLDPKLANALSARNSSILAHGKTPVSKEAYGSILESVLAFRPLAEPNLAKFIELPRSYAELLSDSESGGDIAVSVR
jgi:CRISPR-associated protein (TIGR02710 family)